MIDYGSLFMMIFRFVKLIFKVLTPILVWTGLVYPTALIFIAGIFKFEPSIFLWIAAWALMFYSLVQNIARLIVRDPTVKLYQLVFGWGQTYSETKTLNPRFHEDFVADKPEGFPLGKQKGKWICIPDEYFTHTLTTGGSGTGKSSCFVIPLLLKGSLPHFVIDIKGELAEKTAKPGDLIFDPTSITAFGYNPFNLVTKDNLVLDIMTIATSLIPDGNSKDEFWTLEARNLLAGSLLYYYKHGYNFTTAMRQIQSQSTAKFVKQAVEEGDPDVIVLLGHFDGMADNTLTSVSATVSSRVMVFASDPDLLRCFSMPDEKCIKPQDLLDGRSIYLCIPEARLEVYKHATQLIIGQFMKFFERQPDASGGKPRVDFVLDEFYRLGTLQSVSLALSTLRSRGLRCHIICQSNAQIEKLYDKIGAKIIMDNCAIKILLGASDPETQDFYSKLGGTFDKRKKSTSSNKNDFKIFGGKGQSYSTEEKRLLKPESLAVLGDEAIVFTGKGKGWGRVKKQPYYKTKEYAE